MQLLARCAAVVVAFAMSIGSADAALDPTDAQNLNNYLANGDVMSIELMVGTYQGDAAATQTIAATLLAAAQSLKASSPGDAGLLAAIAVASGGLQGSDSITATNLVNASGNVYASTVVLYSASGIIPDEIASILIGVTINPVQMAQNGAQVNQCSNTNGSTC